MSLENDVVYIATCDNGESRYRIMFTKAQDIYDSDSEFGGYDMYECYDEDYVRCVYYSLSGCYPLDHSGLLVRTFPDENEIYYDVVLTKEDESASLQVKDGVLTVYDNELRQFVPWVHKYGTHVLCDNDLRSLAIFDITVDGGEVVEFKRMKSTGNIRVVMRGSKKWTLLLTPEGKILQIGA